ncbi:hypothetical protein BD310DRAFT_363393 [Dichomitus squalens]|uniref:Uncharacterized protein n=1 Tax=Dichomitus squalens TaxID=114155 RepID=A0A4Q9PZ78_9APHY|nr:hypothetical protein BD310DRAFT_363393 [Dichomitus squalens]
MVRTCRHPPPPHGPGCHGHPALRPLEPTASITNVSASCREVSRRTVARTAARARVAAVCSVTRRTRRRREGFTRRTRETAPDRAETRTEYVYPQGRAQTAKALRTASNVNVNRDIQAAPGYVPRGRAYASGGPAGRRACRVDVPDRVVYAVRCSDHGAAGLPLMLTPILRPAVALRPSLARVILALVVTRH